ncbi:hypothetical protein [Paraburkholderia sp. ZP32-5]|uniref:hypothetical protein n=1 Tax=Paraburkholderia sp. ZP32-5 TaxID=2883245 RepID=UPI001F2B3BFC|nr:hypothetical protein [Paraburkholderia sp. ZP32-5]
MFLAVQLIWAACVVITACAIAFDMHQLGAQSVALTRVEWIAISVCAGPLAGMMYMSRRGAARRELIQSAWVIVGNSTFSTQIRRERLSALKRTGVLGPAIYRTCSTALDAKTPVMAKQAVREVDTSRATAGTSVAPSQEK